MTKEEYIKQIQALPPEKVKKIAGFLLEASSWINSAECELVGTPLEHEDFPKEGSTLWGMIYKGHKMFSQCVNPNA